jgi:hypothetical protein
METTGKTPAVVKVNGMAAFLTRQTANEGVVIPLRLPTGEKTDQWIRIVGAESDAFRASFANLKRALLAIGQIEDKAVREAAEADEGRKMTASLVIGWSFEQEPTFDNVIAFLRDAPQIEKQIDAAAQNRSLFFGERLSSLLDSQSPNSDSTSAQPDAVSPSGPP